MSDEYRPAHVEVIWDAKDVEMRLLDGIRQLFGFATGEGMTPEGARRVGAYVADRAGRIGTPLVSEPPHD